MDVAEADREVVHQLVIDASRDLERAAVLEVGIDRRRGRYGRGVQRVVVRARRREESTREVELVALHGQVVVQVGPGVAQRRQASRLQRPCGVHGDAVVARDARLRDGLARAEDVVAQAQARLPVVPAHARLRPGIVDGREEVGQDAVRRRGGGERLVAILVEADADIRRQAADLVGVADEEVRVIALDVEVGVAGDVGLVGAAGADAHRRAAANLAD